MFTDKQIELINKYNQSGVLKREIIEVFADDNASRFILERPNIEIIAIENFFVNPGFYRTHRTHDSVTGKIKNISVQRSSFQAIYYIDKKDVIKL